MSGNVAATSVEETLKDFWATRPQRPLQGRKIAGVAAGIAQRYQIDPVIVRVAFVALALCNGAGLLMYLLGWLLLPQERDEVSAAESLLTTKGRSSTPTALTVVLGLALIPASGFLFDGGFATIGGLLLSVGGLYLLHRNRGHLNRPDTPLNPTEPVTDMPGQDAVPPKQTPPAWDPLGAAPFAWDLPEPGQPVAPRPQPSAPRRKSHVGGLAFGVAMLVVGGSVIAAQWSPWFTAPHIIGLVLGVLGLGLVVDSFVGGGRGLIGLVIPLTVVGVVLTQAPFDNWDRVGDLSAKPTTIEQVVSRYETGAGSVDLDLTALPNSGTVRTAIEVGVGSATVKVPKDADVEVSCTAGVGDVNCLGQQADGRRRAMEIVDKGSDGPGGLKIVLDVNTGVGEVAVSRG